MKELLARRHGAETAGELLANSPLLGYLIRKTKAANRGSKSRGSFANLYAIYVLAEDYLAGEFHVLGGYSEYEGAKFTNLMTRQRQLPFGEKLQNHALNSRLNDEFHKFYPDVQARPILRDVSTQRYWLNESLFIVDGVNIADDVIEIIDTYVEARRGSFSAFIDACKKIETLGGTKSDEGLAFVASLLQPNADARIFEIVSFAIMKVHYGDKTVWLGFTRGAVKEQPLILYKTGRTNANDGGIDFVMRPLGRFFQVTETLDMKKYFLDIDKIEKFPITFVIKTNMSVEDVKLRLRQGAQQTFGVTRVVESYMEAVEQIVNIPLLLTYLQETIQSGTFKEVIREIIVQSRVEFNLNDDEEAMIRAMDE
ncbi:MAG: restriction endonuclease [Actinobacteria bacterium]|nr:restriction endonuclease [Actinomycetota bacterium]